MIYDYFPRLVERRHQLAGYLCGGEQQMLVIGRALMAQAASCCCSTSRRSGWRRCSCARSSRSSRRSTPSRGTTFLLVEQNAQIALGIADYGYIMENGRIVFDGPAAKLRGNEDVREFYLGLSEAGRRKSFKDLKFYKRRKRWAF